MGEWGRKVRMREGEKKEGRGLGEVGGRMREGLGGGNGTFSAPSWRSLLTLLAGRGATHR